MYKGIKYFKGLNALRFFAAYLVVIHHAEQIRRKYGIFVNVSITKKPIIRLNNKVLEFLEDMSYGIYMYHMLIVFGIVLILKTQLEKMNDIVSTIVFNFILIIRSSTRVCHFQKGI